MHLTVMVWGKTEEWIGADVELFRAGRPPSIVLQFNRHLEANDYHLLGLFFSSSSFSSESTECIFTLAWRRLCSKIIEQNSVSAGDLEVCLRYGPPCYVHGILVLKSNQIQVFTHSPQKAVFGLFVLRFASANTPSLLKQHSQACYSETLSTLTLVAKVVAASHFSQIVRLKFKVYNEFGRPSKKIYQ